MKKKIPQQKYGKLITNDITIHRQYFTEMCSLYGVKVKVRLPRKDKHYTEHSELKATYQGPIEMFCIFEEYPAQKTLRKLGWATELEESSPIIHLPYDLPVEQGTLIDIPSAYGESDDRTFRITEMSSLMIYPASISCKLVPEWKDTVQLREVKDFTSTNFNLLREINGMDHAKDTEDILNRGKW